MQIGDALRGANGGNCMGIRRSTRLSFPSHPHGRDTWNRDWQHPAPRYGLKGLEYVKDILHAPEEQRKLAAEMATLKPMLVELEKQIRANPSSQALQQIKEPLLRFKTTLGHFIDTLRPAKCRLSKVSKQLTWPLWNKKEAQEHLAEFERIKSLFTVWLINDVWDEDKTAQRDRVLEWMTSLSFFLRHSDISSAWEPGTGEWLLADVEFRDWESNAQQILWCPRMRAGKTVLVSMVVNHLRSLNANTAVACIYLNHKETEMQTPVDLLSSLWKQLVVGTRPSLDEVFQILSSAIGEYSKVYLIVDALDEYPEAPRLKLLEHLSMAMAVPTVNLMFTLRPHITLDPFFPGRRVIDIKATEKDIRQYINMYIQRSPRLSKHVRTRPGLGEEIKSRILSNVEGIYVYKFLLAKLHLDSLSTKNTVKAVRDALNRMPKDLDRTYDEAMERIDRQNEDDRHLAHSVLTWVAYAVHPLLVNELREALAIEPGAESVDPDNLLDTAIIISVCAGLVIVDEAMSVVRLIHYTTQEYISFLVTFLALLPLELETPLTFDVLLELSRLEVISFTTVHFSGSQLINHCQTPLILALLIEKDADVNAHGGYCGTILQAATRESDDSMVKYLIEMGADINGLGEFYGTALQVALRIGRESLAQMLIEHGTDVNTIRGIFGTALRCTSLFSHDSIVELLIKNGVDTLLLPIFPGCQQDYSSNPRKKAIIRLLIENGADVNANGGITLQLAASEGNDDLVQFLIQSVNNLEQRSWLLQPKATNQRFDYWSKAMPMQMSRETFTKKKSEHCRLHRMRVASRWFNCSSAWVPT
ncbi:hypothetical protein B0H14DRAFT_3170152 [Mycena olivaceomarginata]|nr:hypothetical protein B0H14DRAFT_3170152 [Mycena olivaceomarginata]